MNRKILIVNASLSNQKFAYAGLEKMLIWLANNLSNNGLDVTICTLFDVERSNKYSQGLKSIELALPYKESFFQRNLVLFTSGLSNLDKIIRKDHYDVVINYGDITFFPIAILKLFNDFKFVVSERGDPNYNQSRLAILKRKLFKIADLVVFQTNGAQSFFNEQIKKKSIIIPNAVSIPESVWKRTSGMHSLVSIGRIDFWQKRLDVLLKAFAEVLQLHNNYVLNIYGTGDMDRLAKLCEELLISENVNIKGSTKEVTKVLLENEIFVLSSDFEGIPNALLEAMSVGMPVVSTDCSPGGAAMLINNSENGLLVERANEYELANAISRFIENKNLADKCAKQARMDMAQYSAERIIDKWILALNNLQ